MTATETQTGFFRCPVPSERSDATLNVGRRRMRVTVAEASIDGFTILIAAEDASRLRIGKPWVLRHDGAVLEVLAQWFFHSPQGQVQAGLRRLRDLTPQPNIGGWMPTLASGRTIDESSSGSLLFGGAILAFLLAISLPGLGDALGTSGHITATLQWVGEGVRGMVR